jgi:L-seryl-tRNA(Ser) seleniumtransferase
MPDPKAILSELRELPPVDALLGEADPGAPEGAPRRLRLAWIREVLEEARAEIRTAAAGAENGSEGALPARGRAAWIEVLRERLRRRAEGRRERKLRRVVNATGVLLHTNLGRAPLPAAAIEALLETGTGYSNLEMDLGAGRRSSRLAPIRELLPELTGAEAGFAVHNNAAAVYLALSALARGREVVVSRAHLVEIGGSFRLPAIMAASGARLVEVGSTNRTRRSDYAEALTPETGLILKVHPSNFRIVGFTEEVATVTLAELAAERGVPLFEDLGSGALAQHGDLAFDEPQVQDSLRMGADLVSFSGDKLLGGPQAGILVGKRAVIERLEKDPVARVVRLDKTALGALEATLEAYLDPGSLRERIPVLGLLARDETALEDLAGRLADRLRRALGATWRVEVLETSGEVGGGSLPGLALPSRAVAIGAEGWEPDRIARVLRCADPAVVGRIEKDRYLLDVRSLLEGEEERIARAASILSQEPQKGREWGTTPAPSR